MVILATYALSKLLKYQIMIGAFETTGGNLMIFLKN